MSRAFVKEDSPQQDVLPKLGELDAALDAELYGTSTGEPKNFITPQGYEKLQTDYQTLAEDDSSPEIIRKKQLLKRRLELAEIIDPIKQASDHVLFGATVTVLDENEDTRIYRIVGIDETDLKSGKVSWVSPIGKALLQAQVGDVVTVLRPQGEEDLEIQKIEYRAID